MNVQASMAMICSVAVAVTVLLADHSSSFMEERVIILQFISIGVLSITVRY
jgi:hypothetical protein